MFKLPKTDLAALRKPHVMVRFGLGVLLVANLVMAAIVFKPWSSSAADLERQAVSLRQQVRAQQVSLEKLRSVVSKVEKARVDGDKFLDQYFMSRRTVSSILLDELEQTARKAGVQQKEAAYSFEPIEGSDTLSKATITANYEGSYANLIRYLNLLDRSARFLIVDTLGAAPQQAGQQLNITLKMAAFVRESEDESPAPAPTPTVAANQVGAR